MRTLVYLDARLFNIGGVEDLWKADPSEKKEFFGRLGKYDEPKGESGGVTTTTVNQKPLTKQSVPVPEPEIKPAPYKMLGPDVSTPAHKLASSEAAQTYASHRYAMHMANGEPEEANRAYQMYTAHNSRAKELQKQGVVATPQHHEDLAIHHHLNREYYKTQTPGRIPQSSKITFHMQHAGHPAGTDINELSAPHQSGASTLVSTGGSTEGTKVLRKIAKSLEWETDIIKGRLGRHIVLTKKDLHQRLKNGHYSLISAGRNIENPAEKDLPEDHPMFVARHEKLRQDLVNSGLDHTEVEGHYGGKEKTFLVHHHAQPKTATPKRVFTHSTFMVHHTHPSEHSTIRDLAKKHGQQSVIHSMGGNHECHYVSGAGAGTHNKGTGHVVMPEAKDYYTKVQHPKSTTKFQLNLDWDTKHPMSNAALKSLTGKALHIHKSEPTNKALFIYL